MTECKVGHVFCDSHMKDGAKTVSLEDKQEKVLAWLEEQGEDDEDILSDIKDGDEGAIDDMYGDMLMNWPVEQCPCCQLQTVTDDDLIAYLLNCYEQTKEEVEEEMRDRFGTLANMNKELGRE